MKISINGESKKFISEKMFGLFFEDINYGADGGLYAEMLENRQFAFKKSCYGKKEKTYDSVYAGDYGYESYPANSGAKLSFMEGDAVSEVNPHYMNVSVSEGPAGFSNKAYDGICMQKGKEYKLVFFARTSQVKQLITFKIIDDKIDNNKIDSYKTDDNKIDDNKIDENKIDENKIDSYKIDDTKLDSYKPDDNKIDDTKLDSYKPDDNKIDDTKLDSYKSDDNKTDNNKVDNNNTDNKINSNSITGAVIAEVSQEIKASSEWVKYELVMTAKDSVKNGLFVVLQDTGSVDYGYISLIPLDAVAGVFRRDLFDMINATRPGFLRFPGGCIVEGANLNNRYRWKDTIGLPWNRKWNWSRWAVHDVTMGQGEPLFYPFYNQSYGLGFYEYFLLSELMGAKALPVLSVGLACQFQSDELVPIDSEEFKEYLQDALDLIEFANGDVNSKWGAIRAEMGHSEPFGLEYIGIGNEQWETERVDFFARYSAFEKAIHKVYPEIELLGSAGPDVTTEKYTKAWEFYRKEYGRNNISNTQENARNIAPFTAAVDEHYYMPPVWFYEHVHMYDDYPRDIPVFAGEYAAHTAKKENNMEAALAEAAFMCGLEKNCDVIRFASAAPLFARQGYVQWIPDYIWFDGDTVMGTPGYYVQKMFGAYTGCESIGYETDAGSDIYMSVTCEKCSEKSEGLSDVLTTKNGVLKDNGEEDNKCRDCNIKNKRYYIKVINSGNEASSISNILIDGEEVDIKNCKILQMNADDLSEKNVLGENEKIVLNEVTMDSGITVPKYSCTVIIVER